MEDPKPCPFCGGEATVFYHLDDTYTVECLCAGCGVNPRTFGYLRGRETAIAAWNRRAERTFAAAPGSDEPPYDDLLRCLENDWHISASWDGLRKFWCIELTEEGVRMRDAAPMAATDVLQAIDQLRRDLSGYHGQLMAHSDLQRHCDNQRKRIAELEGLYAGAKNENAKLRELVTMVWRTARLMDANEHIDGMRITDEFRASCEIAFAELEIEVDG